jgi:hypothetical protein
MAKIIVIVIAYFMATVATGMADPLKLSGASGYTIYDRSVVTDEWNSSYGGYSSTGGDYTGFYLGTIRGNYDEEATDLENLISHYLGSSYEIYSFARVAAESTETSSGAFSVTYDEPDEDGESFSGTWSTVDSDPAVAVNFYTIKGSNEFSLYYVDPALQSGKWVTYHLLNGGSNVPGVSHISASMIPAPVPEPATMFLMGVGITGLIGLRLRRKK